MHFLAIKFKINGKLKTWTEYLEYVCTYIFHKKGRYGPLELNMDY